MRPNGRLMKKISRHETLSVRIAPMSGPAIDDTPHTPAKSACARARSASVYMSPMITMPIGSSPPAPMPCTVLNAMSCVIDVETPLSSEPRRNRASATR